MRSDHYSFHAGEANLPVLQQEYFPYFRVQKTDKNCRVKQAKIEFDNDDVLFVPVKNREVATFNVLP